MSDRLPVLALIGALCTGCAAPTYAASTRRRWHALAAASAKRAWEHCRHIDCDLAATILNVQAHAALAGGDAKEGVRLAQAAEQAARRRADKAETANPLRLLGRTRSQLSDPEGAIAALQQALAIDRSLADPRKMRATSSSSNRRARQKATTRRLVPTLRERSR